MSRWSWLLLALAAFITSPALATTVHIETNLNVPGVGNTFDILLYDDVTPITVENFLDYVTSGRYNTSFFHRSVNNFVVQGGGFTWNGTKVVPMTTDPPIQNEYQLSNVRGTIAMAQTAGNINSATSQFFFNTVDNIGSLDPQKFTVFGQVLGDGMDVIDAIAGLKIFNAGGPPFNELPLQDYDAKNDIATENLVIMTSVTVVPVPEPQTLALVATGGVTLLGLAAHRRRKRAKQSNN